jgi:NAD(P)H dehydrogenase (quinone)
VRAMAHREDGRSARLQAQGAEVAIADMSDVDHVAEAVTDVQRACLCPPFDPYISVGGASQRHSALDEAAGRRPRHRGHVA